MGATKYPITDPNFRLKVFGACQDQEERGLIAILDITGMHIKCVHELTEKNVIKQGSTHYLRWQRAKTSKTLRFPIPKDRLDDILYFVNRPRKKTVRWYFDLIKQIGDRAGYQDVSSMTFRHNRAIRALREEGMDLFQVPHLLGCSLNVAARNYTVLKMDELHEKNEEGENSPSGSQ
jgi:integrase